MVTSVRNAECRSACVNLPYTDRDIQQLSGRLAVLEERAGAQLPASSPSSS